MSDLFLIVRGGFDGSVGTDLLVARFTWTDKSEAAAKQAVANAIPDVVASLFPHEVDAPPCPICEKPMSWSAKRKKWRCHNAHRPRLVEIPTASRRTA